ncbi:hypothetical protein P5673_002002 [Acropora cervicornis]|uniref:Uncharacterized protein n=1 Tax=Acropora cervicornis TaxID=6130 RepID=A0AAD9R4M1_ACRCE|nr:hypothetical protein P5673_002002 [Acropora cervicornis]
MELEIEHSLEQDVIEKVPIGWVSPPVVNPKKLANQTIPRRLIQHPTIDDVVNERGGSTVFFHLDVSGERMSPGRVEGELTEHY